MMLMKPHLRSYAVVVAALVCALQNSCTWAKQRRHLWKPIIEIARSEVGRTENCYTESNQECTWRCIRHDHLDTFSHQDGECCLYHRRVGNPDWDDANVTATAAILEFFRLEPGECPANFTALGKSCYKFVTDSMASWDDAKSACESLGADLISIDTEGERLTIDAYTRQHHPIQATPCSYSLVSPFSASQASGCPGAGVWNSATTAEDCMTEACNHAGATAFNYNGNTACNYKACVGDPLDPVLANYAGNEVYLLTGNCTQFTKMLSSVELASYCPHVSQYLPSYTWTQCMEQHLQATCNTNTANVVNFDPVNGGCYVKACDDVGQFQLAYYAGSWDIYAYIDGYWTGLKKNPDGTHSHYTEPEQVVTYLPWWMIESIDADEDCVLASPPHHFELIGELCSVPSKYVCEVASMDACP